MTSERTDRRIGSLVNPRAEKAIPSQHPDLPYVGLEHIEAHTTKLLGFVPATEMKSTAKRFYSGDVLYSRLRPYLNKVWHADRDGLCSAEFIVLPGNEEVDANFLRYRLNSSDFVRFANGLNAGDRPRVDFDQISSFILPPFTLDAQRAAVAEIEEQFTRLEAGIAALRRVQANFKRYRAAVLKAACEGRLVATEAELAKSEKRKFETGEELLVRILGDRRQNWKGRGKYKDAAAPDSANVPANLPEGWSCASVDQITENFDGRRVPLKSVDRNKRSGKYPYYGASGIIDDIDDFLFDGDYLLIAEDGANLLSRSTPIAFRATGRFWVNNHAHIIQTRNGIPLTYLSIFMNGRDISFSVTGSAQPKLTQAALNKIPVPLPPLAEQTRIVAEVERRLSVVEELEAVVSISLQRATRLRQSILQRAFSGEI